jgi:membrane-bound lytic murein transglycosylase B
LPPGFDRSLANIDVTKTLADWQRLGVRRADGRELPAGEGAASVILPGGEEGPALLVYDNFRAVLKWNKSLFFASAVGFLADGIEQR